MKSDVIHVSNDGKGVGEALRQADLVAEYLGADKRDAIHLRLFAEEIMGLMQGLTGEQEADFWIETDKDGVHLHLLTHTEMDSEKREKLIAASTSGKNDVKGFLGKIRSAFESAIVSMETGYSEAVATGLVETGGRPAVPEWSLSQYKASINKDDSEKWDELEHSVLSKLADEIRIRLKGSEAELIVDKKLNQ